MKRCPKCLQNLPLESFHRNSNRKDGLQCYCRDCCSLERRIQRGNEDGNEGLFEGLRRLLLAELRNRGYKWCSYCKNAKPAKDFYDGVQRQCRECSHARRDVWGKTSAGRAYAARKDHKRRAAKLNAPAENVDKRLVFTRDNGLCGICNLEVDPVNWHLDHVVPLARGGSHTYDNVQVSHPRCNLVKGARLLS